MPTPIKLLIFLLLELLLLPITLIGYLLFTGGYALQSLRSDFSATAYDPFFARWSLHHLGKREDAAVVALAPYLPGVSRWPVRLAMGPTLWAMQLSGYTLRSYSYPVYSSTSIFNSLGQRTRFFDEAISAHLDDVEQVVILGAGWDTRAYGVAKRDGVHVFEVDAPDTGAVKQRALTQAGIDTGHVTFVAADFNRESWLDALLRTDFDPALPTFVLWEGVTYYLTDAAVAQTLRTVSEKLAPGSAIAFDYVSQQIVAGQGPAVYRLALITLRLFREPWQFGISTEPPAQESLAEFLQAHGLRLEAFELFGKEGAGEQAHGGLTLAMSE